MRPPVVLGWPGVPIAIAAPAQSDGIEHRVGPGFSGAGIRRHQRQRQCDILAKGQVRQDAKGLEDEADPLPPQPRAFGLVERTEIDTVDRDASFIGFVEPSQDIEQRRFADACSPMIAMSSPDATSRSSSRKSCRGPGTDFASARAETRGEGVSIKQAWRTCPAAAT